MRLLVDEAANGVEALGAIAAHRPDGMLVDHRMPGTDGDELVARMRAFAAAASIPVVLLTATHDREELAVLEAMGVGVIPKPFDPETSAMLAAAALGRGG